MRVVCNKQISLKSCRRSTDTLTMTKPNNPNRTGGPRTDKGKRITSSNAIKTGAYSSMVVLPGESIDDFDDLLESFIEDCQPMGAAENVLVRELAVIQWKKLRLERVEYAQHRLALVVPITVAELAQVGCEAPEGFEGMFNQLRIFTPELIKDFQEDFQFCERLLGGKASYDDFQTLKQDYPDLYQKLVAMAQEGRAVNYSDDTLMHFRVVDEHDQTVYATELIAHSVSKRLKEIIEIYEHRDEYLAAFKKVRVQRRIELMANNRLGRPVDELSRAFARTLSDLRKQQEWRRNHQVIDVTPIEQ